jgi:RHS repeat-associated protein
MKIYFKYMVIQKINLKRPIAILLAFLFFLTPLAPVFAGNASASKTDFLPSADNSSRIDLTPKTTAPIGSSPTSDSSAVTPSTIPDPTSQTPAIGTPAPTVSPDDQPSNDISLPTDEAATTPASSKADTKKSTSVNSGTSGQVTPNPGQDLNSKNILPTSNQTTGALDYGYTFNIPGGRNNLQPDVTLNYDSQNLEEGGEFGLGWSLGTAYITRRNTHGIDQLYTRFDFTSSMSGDLVPTDGANTNFAARVDDGSFVSYTYATSSNSWTATDKKGNTFSFGAAATERQDDVNNSNHVFKWMISKITDSNGNNVKYYYSKDQGQIYPQKITYSGTGSSDGVYAVNFSLENRTDPTLSAKTGFSVTTNSRVKTVNVIFNSSQTILLYTLNYSVGVNGKRSLLQSVQQTGYDVNNIATSLPATTFSYENNSTVTDKWVQKNITIPSGFNYHNQWSAFADINGDGLPDLVSAFQGTNGVVTQQVALNTGNGNFEMTNDFPLPSDFLMYIYPNSTNYSFVDVNGDGKADILYCQGVSVTYECFEKVYINNGAGWTYNANWVFPTSDTYFRASARNLSIIDINNDNLPDLVFGGRVFLNTGSGWAEDQSGQWHLPGIVRADYPVNVFADINNDGVPDLLRSQTFWGYNQGNYCINDKSSFLATSLGNYATSTDYISPTYFIGGITSQCYPINRGVQLADVNADGLPDMVQGSWQPSLQPNAAYINNGSAWYQDNTFNIPGRLANDDYSQLASMIDVDGDGTVDYLPTVVSPTSYYQNTSSRADVLKTITYPTGGVTTATYKASSQYTNTDGSLANPSLPIVIQTVSSITTTDPGAGISSIVNYSYANGSYYYNMAFDRKFAGFGKITRTDVASKTVSYFHLGNAGSSNSTNGEYMDSYGKIGQAYRVESYDLSGNLKNLNINKWDEVSETSGSTTTPRTLDFLAQSLNETYDASNSHRDIAQSYTRDNITGNVLINNNYGEVTGNDDGTFTDSGTDDYTTDFGYATSTATSTISLLDHITTVDHSAAKVKETKYYYDNLSFGIADKGNQTKEEDWKDTTNYINSQKTYNSYGLVTASADPRGKTTNYSYDSNNLFPATVTNPLSQTTQYLYNYSNGKIATTTDANGNIFVTNFDGLGRPILQKQPDPNATSTLLNVSSITYVDTSGAVSIKKTNYLDTTTTVDSYTYFDTLGRKKQERQQAEAGNFSVKDYVYDNRGFLQKESLPYFSSGSSATTATTTANLYLNYSYDALGRIISTANSVGTTTNSYSNWETTVTDPNGKPKNLFNDAYNNLIQVDEILFNGISTTTNSTLYTYNGLGNLTNITDASGNVRNFTYDGLSRRLTAQDLHSTGDGTYGSYSYTYDDSNNLTQKVDPKSQTVNYSYDDINRPLTEDYTGANGTEVSYVYDSCLNGVGHLCSASTSAVSVLNSYNALGKVNVSTSTISSLAYPTAYTYDRQGNQINIINPDGSQVSYVYNAAGLIHSISEKDTATATPTSIINNFSYSPNGQVAVISYGNNATTTNSYDAAHLYRLSSKVSAVGSSTPQSLVYTYDSNGNITQVADTSSTHTAKTVNYIYDDLNRLVSASSTGASYGGDYLYQYSYDALGNILSRTENNAATTYTYSSGTSAYLNPQAVATTTLASVATVYSYDNNGNQTTASIGTSTPTSYTWDYNNRLLSSIIPGSGTTTVTSTYDPSGQRVSYSTSFATATPLTTYYPSQNYNIDTLGNSTKHIFANGIMVATITVTPHILTGNNPSCTPPSSGDWTISSSCTFTGVAIAPQSVIVNAGKLLTLAAGSKLLIDLKHYKLLVKHTAGVLVKKTAALRQVKASDTGTNIYYQFTDNLSGQGVTTDSSGNTVELSDYYPYGSSRLDEKTGTLTEQRKYTGQEYDASTGLNYYNARYQNPNTGRFISQDQAFLALGDNQQLKAITQQKLAAYLSDPQNLNSYSYARNNPILYNDPTGQSFESVLSWANAHTGIGQTVDNSTTYNYMVAHPVQGGAAVGVGSGLVVAGFSYLLSEGYTGLGISVSAATTLGTAGTSACAAECDKVSPGAQQSFQAIGKIGETLSGLEKNTTRIPSLSGTANYRIPDGLTNTVLSEVKNVGQLSFTNQLRDFASYAQSNGLNFNLYVRPTTQLSGPLQQAINEGQVMLKYLNGQK